MPTIRDVANMAGVSTSTVSLAFSDPKRVGAKTLELASAHRLEDAVCIEGLDAALITSAIVVVVEALAGPRLEHRRDGCVHECVPLVLRVVLRGGA